MAIEKQGPFREQFVRKLSQIEVREIKTAQLAKVKVVGTCHLPST